MIHLSSLIILCLAQTWRMRERMKTVSVALVICLNVGVDPEGDKRYKTTWVKAIINRELAEGKLQLGSPCPNATRVDATTITCTVPPGAGRDAQLTITVGGQTSSFLDDDATYDYAVPVPSAIIVPTANNGYLVPDGPEFGINASTSKVIYYNPLSCNLLQFSSLTIS